MIVVVTATLALASSDALKPPLIPQASPPAQPRSLKQIGASAEATRSAMPADNPQSAEKVGLGQRLFFDGRLSANGTVACSTCHDPAHAFTDGGWQRRRQTFACRLEHLGPP
jgi:cytochrome c peroxidase